MFWAFNASDDTILLFWVLTLDIKSKCIPMYTLVSEFDIFLAFVYWFHEQLFVQAKDRQQTMDFSEKQIKALDMMMIVNIFFIIFTALSLYIREVVSSVMTFTLEQNPLKWSLFCFVFTTFLSLAIKLAMIRLQNKINRYIILFGMILCAFVLVLGCSLIIIFYHFAVNIYITFALSLVLITFLRDYYYVCRTIWIS